MVDYSSGIRVVYLRGVHAITGGKKERNYSMEQRQKYFVLAMIPFLIAINVALGAIVFTFKLPIYVDAVGTILAALMFGNLGYRGMLYAMFVGAASFLVGSILLNPVLVWFIPTQVAIAIYSFTVLRPVLNRTSHKQGRPFFSVVLAGLGLGVVSGIVSAPIIAYLFGGVTGSGASLIVGTLIAAGHNVLDAVLLSGMASEPIDKLIQATLAVALFSQTPSRFKNLLGANPVNSTVSSENSSS